MPVRTQPMPLRIRSLVGLIPLFAVEILKEEWLERLTEFKRRADWFIENRPDLVDDIACLHSEGVEHSRLLALVNRNRLERILRVMLSEQEFLSAKRGWGHGTHEASIALHQRCGFETVGTEREVGRKFGTWLDVVEMQRLL